jgi:hypothetical protein
MVFVVKLSEFQSFAGSPEKGKGNTMELYWKINGIEFGIRSFGYSWTAVKQVNVDNDPLFFLDDAVFNHAWTECGARFAAWRYARRWASFDGCDEVMQVFSNKPDGTPDRDNPPLWNRTLKVKVVPEFFTSKSKS